MSAHTQSHNDAAQRVFRSFSFTDNFVMRDCFVRFENCSCFMGSLTYWTCNPFREAFRICLFDEFSEMYLYVFVVNVSSTQKLYQLFLEDISGGNKFGNIKVTLVQRQLREDWNNREYAQVVSDNIRHIADFLCNFGMSLRFCQHQPSIF
ncbi:unnamed protein product [Wuchereria bancrofti]|uniref:Uncharacterized protein n=1 Tax=Wuchereria bancrofti TaxID=6293 RepID=A0A3P7EBF8_WUCBA|nr:unnamed protein product [Wuchereria bancrofti]